MFPAPRIYAFSRPSTSQVHVQVDRTKPWKEGSRSAISQQPAGIPQRSLQTPFHWLIRKMASAITGAQTPHTASRRYRISRHTPSTERRATAGVAGGRGVHRRGQEMAWFALHVQRGRHLRFGAGSRPGRGRARPGPDCERHRKHLPRRALFVRGQLAHAGFVYQPAGGLLFRLCWYTC